MNGWHILMNYIKKFRKKERNKLYGFRKDR